MIIKKIKDKICFIFKLTLPQFIFMKDGIKLNRINKVLKMFACDYLILKEIIFTAKKVQSKLIFQ